MALRTSIFLFLLTFLAGSIYSSWSPDLTVFLRTEGAGNPVFFIPHSDETAALETARRFVSRLGHGTVVWMNCGGHRRCRWIDPNRYFGFCENGQRASVMKTYREQVFSHFAGRPLVIALHNNQGCSGSICTNQPYKGARALASAGSGPSDVVIFNGPEAEPSGRRARFSECLSANHISQLYEKSGAVDDCSMSETATRMGYYYFNLDTQLTHGAGTQLTLLNQAIECAEHAFAADRVYSIHKFVCKNGKQLGLITHQAQSSITMMAHYCPFPLLEGKAPGETVREICQNDKTDWAVKCFNDEFVPKCEDRNHKIKVECFKDY